MIRPTKPDDKPKPRGGSKAYFMERVPGTAHWSVWEMDFIEGVPVFSRLVEATPYMLAKHEVWRRVINEAEQVLHREYGPVQVRML